MYHNGNLSVKLINDQLLPWFSVEQMYKKMNEIFPSTDRKWRYVSNRITEKVFKSFEPQNFTLKIFISI